MYGLFTLYKIETEQKAIRSQNTMEKPECKPLNQNLYNGQYFKTL